MYISLFFPLILYISFFISVYTREILANPCIWYVIYTTTLYPSLIQLSRLLFEIWKRFFLISTIFKLF
jgi:hypothetical protein